jgi:uridine monophosphate synthetase
MGRDAIDPFLKYEGRGLFILCRTSNKSAGAFQDLAVSDPPAAGTYLSVQHDPLYIEVARRAASWSDAIGLVVEGNDPEGLRRVRAAAACALRDEIERARAKVVETARPRAASASCAAPKASVSAVVNRPSLKSELMAARISTGCFMLGDFVLKSGKRSPFYLDLRRLVSDPAAMTLAAEAYAIVAEGLTFDRIAGIPAAALPLATTASLRMGRPMLWPRMPVKDHGTGNRVEGAFVKGEKLLLPRRPDHHGSEQARSRVDTARRGARRRGPSGPGRAREAGARGHGCRGHTAPRLPPRPRALCLLQGPGLHRWPASGGARDLRRRGIDQFRISAIERSFA